MPSKKRDLYKYIQEQGELVAKDGETEMYRHDGEFFVVVNKDEPRILENDEFEMDDEMLIMVDSMDVSDDTVTLGTDETSSDHRLRNQEISGWSEVDDDDAEEHLN